MSHIVLNGDNIEVLKKYPDNYFDAVVTDPPYGLGKEPDATELMKSWVETGYHEVKGSGFMGKEWDAFVPQPIFWKEVFRVLKHGGHVLAFYGTRTYDWGVMAMRFAGFEVRDTIYWHYGSGFPKSHNISKAIDKLNGTYVKGQESPNSRRGIEGYKSGYDHAKVITLSNPQSENAKQWDGWGSALKPASEPIVMARKPLEKGLSIAENVLKYGTGAINIDGCRVKTDEKIENHSRGLDSSISKGKYGNSKEQDTHQTQGQIQGRFPANLIMTHHPECECNGTKNIKPSNGSGKASGTNNKFNKGVFQDENREGKHIEGGFTDADGQETVEDWNCHPDCPIKIMDEQSGVLKSGKLVGEYNGFGNNGIYGKSGTCNRNYEGDKGGASRFFYCAKASKSERNKGLDEFDDKLKMTQMRSANGSGEKNFEGGFQDQIMKNIHPTVKPIKLMQYLVRLVTPPNGIVLDPFCGSGTTGIACKLERFQFVGIEQDPEYTKIAEARINNYVDEKEEIKQKQTTENKEISQGSLF